jgi:hypothetical protein
MPEKEASIRWAKAPAPFYAWTQSVACQAVRPAPVNDQCVWMMRHPSGSRR